VERIAQYGVRVDGFFYNPNIHPEEEYERRHGALLLAAAEKKLNVIFPAYNSKEYFNFIGDDTQKPLRCEKCWELRLRETASHANANGYDAFTSTLLISPYQNHDAIKKIGERLAEEYKLIFHYLDFRPGFRRSQSAARGLGIYRQKYCGCSFSDREIKGKRISNGVAGRI